MAARTTRGARAPRRPEDLLRRRGGAVELLWLPALAFAAASGLRRRLYDARLVPSFSVDVPVACLGNLTAGGTGKSPLVQWLVERLIARGRAPAVLSRGHGRAPGEAGDEARAFALRFPRVPLVENPDRVRGARALVARGADVIVLDDGFQHRRLARDLDLVCVDATRPFGLPADANGRALAAPLPRGLLREPLAALGRAHALVLTRVDQVGEAALDALRARLERAAPGLPQVLARHAPVRLVDAGGASGALDDLGQARVDLVSGIGNPDAFEATVRGLGAEVVEHRRFPDHHAYRAEDLAGLGADGRALLTTQKDLVKLGSFAHAARALEVAIEVLEGEAVLDALIDGLLAAKRERRA